MPELSVNVDHVATLRQARKAKDPDPVTAALLAELGGAKGITVHLRQDRRHIQERDVRLLKEVLKSRLNIEMSTSEDIVGVVLQVKPYMATLVPERREEVTTEGGLDLSGKNERLREVVSLLKEAGIVVSFFIDPHLEVVKKARKLGADKVEIHTGIYARAQGEKRKVELERIAACASLGNKIGLRVGAGHDLNYENVREIALIEELEELSIGHAIVARATLVGMVEAVREMVRLIEI